MFLIRCVLIKVLIFFFFLSVMGFYIIVLLVCLCLLKVKNMINISGIFWILKKLIE